MDRELVDFYESHKSELEAWASDPTKPILSIYADILIRHVEGEPEGSR